MRLHTDHSMAVVTGAARGIGAAVAWGLAVDRPVALLDRDAAAVESLAADIRAKGGRALACAADVTDSSQIDDALERAERELGPLGVLVNVAGVLHTGDVVAFDEHDWAAVFAVNSTGVFLASRAAARRMTAHGGDGGGAIVTVASNAAGVPRAGMAAYAASKAAAVAFTKCLGLELAKHGIRCNVVCPGSTDTAMQRGLWADPDNPAEAARVIAGDPIAFRTGIPLGRLAEPDDIADAVLFLVSRQARHITMHDLYVDGGATLRA